MTDTKTIGKVVIHWTDSSGVSQSAAGELEVIENGVAVFDWGYGVDLMAKDFRMEAFDD